MKKYLVILFIFISGSSFAQPFVNIPDPVFRDVLDSIAPGCIVGTTLNTTHPGLGNASFLELENYGISDITGIQYLTNLASIDCSHNQISFVPTLPNSLVGLYIGHNQLNSFPTVPSGITNLKVDYNPIGSIGSIPSQINNLDVSGCGLNSLPVLPSQMIVIQCKDNNLVSLPTLPANLELLQCQNNSIVSLPTLPNSLYQLLASGNGLACIPNLPTNPLFTSDIGYVICGAQGAPDSWYLQTAVPVNSLTMANCFSIGTKCYLGSGASSPAGAYFWEFNTTNNTWTQKANVPTQSRLEPVAFSIGNKGYFGMGQGGNPVANNDIWEYNPVTNSWLQKASYPGTGYMGMASFVIGDQAYVGLGIGLNYTFPTAFYKFDPSANSWTSIANFPGLGRREAACFSIGNKGYVCAGDGSNSLLATSYCFNTSTASWSTIASTPSNLNESAAFSINGKGYVACGQYDFWNGPRSNGLLQYDPALNSWSSKAPMTTLGRQMTTGCQVGGRAYVGTGVITSTGGGSTQTNDWWEYTPTCYAPSNQIFATNGTGACTGDSVLLFADAGNSYQWKRNGTNIIGTTNYYNYATISGSYTCAISNSCGSVTSIAQNVVINAPVAATVTPSGATTFCAGGSVTLNANTSAGFNYQWKKFGNVIAGATSSSYIATSAGTYKVVVTNSGGCSTSSSSVTITINPLPTATNSAAGPTTFCTGGSVQLNANSGAGLSYQWKKGSNLIAGATASSYIASAAATYKVIVTNANGCSKTSNGITTTLLAAPTAIITAGGPTTFCAGDSVVFTANTGAGLTYQWKKGANNVAGATSFKYSAKVAGNYKCTVTNANGCTKNSNAISVSVPCRIAGENIDEKTSDFRIYPNPSMDEFYIEGNNLDPEKITVRDLQGKIVPVKLSGDGEHAIILSGIKPGIYLVYQDENSPFQPRKIVKLE